MRSFHLTHAPLPTGVVQNRTEVSENPPRLLEGLLNWAFAGVVQSRTEVSENPPRLLVAGVGRVEKIGGDAEDLGKFVESMI